MTHPNPDLTRLKAAFKNGRPMVFCEMPPDVAYGLGEEEHKLAWFTHTWHGSDTAKSKLPTLAVLEITPDPTSPAPGIRGYTAALIEGLARPIKD